LGAPGAELESTFPQPSRLALSCHELPTHVDYEVVSLIDAEGYENPITTLDQLRLNRGLAALTDIDRVIGQLMLPERHRQTTLGTVADAKRFTPD
jgi:hypothetical protein